MYQCILFIFYDKKEIINILDYVFIMMYLFYIRLKHKNEE